MVKPIPATIDLFPVPPDSFGPRRSAVALCPDCAGRVPSPDFVPAYHFRIVVSEGVRRRPHQFPRGRHRACADERGPHRPLCAGAVSRSRLCRPGVPGHRPFLSVYFTTRPSPAARTILCVHTLHRAFGSRFHGRGFCSARGPALQKMARAARGVTVGHLDGFWRGSARAIPSPEQKGPPATETSYRHSDNYPLFARNQLSRNDSAEGWFDAI